MIGELFNLILLRPMINALLLLYTFLGHNFALAIVILTVVLRLITQPFMAKQLNSSKKMNELQPQLKELQKKYGNDRERLAQEQMKLYKENGVNPMAGCLPMLLQFPIWIAVYQSIIQLLGRTPTQLLALSKHIYNLGVFAGLPALLPLASRFLWLDLGRPDPYYIIPILVAATQWLQQKMMTPAASPDGDSQAQQMSQSMLMTMPLMFGFITINLASGLGLYFIASSVIGIVIQYFTMGWGGLAPQRAKGAAKKASAEEQPAQSIISAAKRLIAPRESSSPEPVAATRADSAATQSASTDQQRGGSGQSKAGTETAPTASMQKGSKSGSRKKKR